MYYKVIQSSTLPLSFINYNHDKIVGSSKQLNEWMLHVNVHWAHDAVQKSNIFVGIDRCKVSGRRMISN